MPKSFQWITLLLIESIYFAGIRLKGPHTSVWIILSNSIGPLGSTSKFQIHRTFGKHVQTSNHRTSGKHVQIQIHGPRGSMSKLQSIRPLGSMSKFKSMDLWEAHPKFNLWTSRKHVQDSNPSDLWEARPNFNPLMDL